MMQLRLSDENTEHKEVAAAAAACVLEVLGVVWLSLILTCPLKEMKTRTSSLTSVVGDSRPGCEDERAVRGGSKAGESSALLGMLLATDGGVAPAPDASEPPGPAGQDAMLAHHYIGHTLRSRLRAFQQAIFACCLHTQRFMQGTRQCQMAKNHNEIQTRIVSPMHTLWFQASTDLFVLEPVSEERKE